MAMNAGEAVPVLYKHCGCSTCAAVNPQVIENFWKNKSSKDGHGNYCKPCHRAKCKIWEDANRDKSNQKAVRLRAKWKAEDPDKVWANKRNSVLKCTYGITLDDYNAMYDRQHGLCAICLRHALEFPKKLVVDHDHTTNKVRELLCGQCNQMLGQAKENIETLRSAIDYLEKHK